MTSRFSCIFSPTFIPFTIQFQFGRKRTIRYDVIDKYAHWIKTNGIRGVLVNGTAGEGVCQRIEERKRSSELWLEASRKHNLTCMVHVGGTAVTSVRDLAEHAEEKQADAVLCLPELFFRPTCEEDLVHYLKDVAEHCPTRPLFYYHFPAFTGVNCKAFALKVVQLNSIKYIFVSVSMPRFCDIAERDIPTFAGIKYTSGDLNEGANCLKPGRTIFLGSNTLVSAAVALGFDSAILVSLNVCPDLSPKILAAMREQRLADACEAQAQLTKRFNEIGTAIKAEFNRMNPDTDCGPARKPLLNLSNKQK